MCKILSLIPNSSNTDASVWWVGKALTQNISIWQPANESCQQAGTEHDVKYVRFSDKEFN